MIDDWPHPFLTDGDTFEDPSVPLPPVMRLACHPLHCDGSAVQYEPELSPGWAFDRSTGEPWDIRDLAQMVKQLHKIAELPCTVIYPPTKGA